MNEFTLTLVGVPDKLQEIVANDLYTVDGVELVGSRDGTVYCECSSNGSIADMISILAARGYEAKEAKEGEVCIPVSEFRRLCDKIKIAFEKPTNKAAISQGRTALGTLTDYIPE
jgi:hypothetical protein